MNQNMENYIAEYNNMWSKLNLIAEHHNSLFLFTLTASGAILTFAIQQEKASLAFVNMIILILLRCRVMSYRDDYYMTLVYIRKVLEPKLCLNSNILLKLNNSKVANLHYFIYSIFGVGTVAACLYIDSQDSYIISVGAIFLILILILDVYYFFYSKNIYKNYERRIDSI